MQQYWFTIIQRLNIIFKRSLYIGVGTCLLGLNNELPTGFENRDLLHILLHVSWSCGPLIKGPLLTSGCIQ